MNREGQAMLGVMLLTIIGIIVSITIYSQAIVPTIGEVTSTADIANRTLTTSGSQIYIPVRSVSNFVAYNSTAVQGKGGCGVSFNTSTCIISAGNYTITSPVLNPTNGELATLLQWNANGFNNSINASFTAQPLSYVADSGARSVTALIVIFAALALAVIALGPVLKEAFDF